MKKRMRCKAHGAGRTGATLSVVRILTSRATKQLAFSSPLQPRQRSMYFATKIAARIYAAGEIFLKLQQRRLMRT